MSKRVGLVAMKRNGDNGWLAPDNHEDPESGLRSFSLMSWLESRGEEEREMAAIDFLTDGAHLE